MSIQIGTALCQAVSRSLYSISFSGNGGEEELTIHASGGQDGRTHLIIIEMRCDGGARVLWQCLAEDKEVVEHVRREAARWAKDAETVNFVVRAFVKWQEGE